MAIVYTNQHVKAECSSIKAPMMHMMLIKIGMITKVRTSVTFTHLSFF